MSHRELSERLSESLAATFAEALRLVDVDDDLWRSRPDGSDWTVAEICEHLTLTHHYLLILIDKIAARANRRLAAGDVPGAEPSALDVLEPLLDRGRPWPAPEHMIPSGGLTRGEIRAGLEEDRARCLAHLRALPDGEGTLHRIRFSPVDLHLDLYQFLALVDIHMRRHLARVARG